MLYKDAKKLHTTLYKYIKNKKEWRINYSFGLINNILQKQLDGNVFGKQHNCEWIRETNKQTRKFLIDKTREIANKLKENGYTKLKHFGLDIIKDLDTETYYFLELNKANGLNEESAYYLLKGFLRENF